MSSNVEDEVRNLEMNQIAAAAVEAVWQLEPNKKVFHSTFLLFLAKILRKGVDKELQAVQEELRQIRGTHD